MSSERRKSRRRILEVSAVGSPNFVRCLRAVVELDSLHKEIFLSPITGRLLEATFSRRHDVLTASIQHYFLIQTNFS